MTPETAKSQRVAIIGGGPAGLMAAEVLSGQGIQVDVFDAMPSVGRKFLMAGKSGLNLTHAESAANFLAHYTDRQSQLAPIIEQFDASALRAWAHELGIDTFVGSSGHVFPREMKAAPLLRAWLRRLRAAGVRFHVRHRWVGFDNNGNLRFHTDQGETTQRADASLLAMGGGSWPKLGSDAAWVPILTAAGIDVRELRPANCGFEVTWSEHMRTRFAGKALKNVSLHFTDRSGHVTHKQGEFVISEYGIEGSLVYAFSALLRDRIEQDGRAMLYLDLLPGVSRARIQSRLSTPRGKRSWSDYLRRQLGLRGVKIALLYEHMPGGLDTDVSRLTECIKALPLVCERPRPLAEAISSAGGVAFEALDSNLMIQSMPGVFCAGEMLDWEAPTGGYLLTACFASGYVAGQGVFRWLRK